MILAAALLRKLGHDAVPLVTPEHAAIGVAAPPGMPGTFVDVDGKKYFYAETTGEGHLIGELPDEVDAAGLRVAPLR